MQCCFCCAFALKTCTLRIVINKERCSDSKDGKIWDYLLAMFVGYLWIDKKFVSLLFTGCRKKTKRLDVKRFQLRMPVTSLTPTDYIIVSRFLTGVGQKTNRENNRLRKKTNRENNRLRKKTNREKEQQNKKENKDREEKNNRLRTKTKREKEGNNRRRKNNKNIIFWSRQNRRKLLLTKRRLETSFRNDKKEFFGRWYFNKNVSPSKIGFLLQSQTISLLPVLLSSSTPLGDFGNSSFPQFSWFNRRKKNLFKKAKTSF